MKRVQSLLLIYLWFAACHRAPEALTTVSLSTTGKWLINGEVIHSGTTAEGMLLNVRMVNAVFADEHKPEIDPEEITDRFIAQLSAYAACGVNAFTLNLQGGFPGYEGALNSAFQPDGTLKEAYVRRVDKVIRACDQAGLVVILGCFYQRQDQLLTDAMAVQKGVTNVALWIKKQGYQNVVLEIANEYPHRGFDHAIIRTPEGMASLIRLVKKTSPPLLVSASGLGDGRCDSLVAAEADYILLHFNSTAVEEFPVSIQACTRFKKAIVCNEDDKVAVEAVAALQTAISHRCSWGYMNNRVNQSYPFRFYGCQDDSLLYLAMKQMTNR